MLKRNGQPRNQLPQYGRQSDANEQAARREAMTVIDDDLKVVRSLSQKLREIESNTPVLGTFDPRKGQVALAEPNEDRQPWEICAHLVELDRCEVFLCKRPSEHGMEYAIMDRSPESSAYAQAKGVFNILQTSDNPRQLLQDYVQSERQTLKLMVGDLMAKVRETLAERFPDQRMDRVARSIARMFQREIFVGVSQPQVESVSQAQRANHGMRI